MRVWLAIAAVMLAALAPVSAAWAGEPVPSRASEAGTQEGQAPAAEAPAKEGESGASDLPFTGTDAVALLAVALSLVAAGVALRRLSAG